LSLDTHQSFQTEITAGIVWPLCNAAVDLLTVADRPRMRPSVPGYLQNWFPDLVQYEPMRQSREGYCFAKRPRSC
jgi:hypothetical protein